MNTDNNGSKGGERIPQRWSPKYDRVLYMTFMNCSAKETGAGTGLSEKQVYRIRHMPMFKEKLEKIRSDGAIQSTSEHAQRQIASIVPMAIDRLVQILGSEKSLPRDVINACNSLLDRILAKQARLEASVVGSMDHNITINVPSLAQFEYSPVVESSFEIVCGDCHKSYAPDTKHICGVPALPAGVCDICQETHEGGTGCKVSELPEHLKPEALRRADWPNVVESTGDI